MDNVVMKWVAIASIIIIWGLSTYVAVFDPWEVVARYFLTLAIGISSGMVIGFLWCS